MHKKFFIKPATCPLLLGKGLNIGVGLIFIQAGIINLTTKSFQTYMILLNFILVFMEVYYLFSVIFQLAPNLKFMPRVEIEENGILIKDDILLRSKYNSWDHLKSIDLGMYQNKIQTKSEITRSFRINDGEEFISEQIKSEII